MDVFLLILGVVLFIGLVVVHEWGHFIAARRGKVEVEEFGIFFPPKVWGKKLKGGFEFTINALPLGGFVRLKGENDEDKTPGSFGAASLSTKVKIMLAGIFMNLVVAFGLLMLLALTGMPKLIDNQFTIASDTKVVRQVENQGVVLIDSVVDNSPAAAAGLRSGDQILRFNNQAITSPNQVGEISSREAGREVPITVMRDGEEQTLQAKLNAENKGSGYLGVASRSGEEGIQLQRSTWSAPVVAGGLIGQFTQLTYQGIGTALFNLIKGDTAKASEQVSGPVGIVAILDRGSELGISFVLMIIAIISLTLALINALPIPALDGGRLFVTLVFRALRKPLKKGTEEWIHGTGFVALMLLFVLITIVDVKRFF